MKKSRKRMEIAGMEPFFFKMIHPHSFYILLLSDPFKFMSLVSNFQHAMTCINCT